MGHRCRPWLAYSWHSRKRQGILHPRVSQSPRTAARTASGDGERSSITTLLVVGGSAPAQFLDRDALGRQPMRFDQGCKFCDADADAHLRDEVLRFQLGAKVQRASDQGGADTGDGIAQL